MNSQIPNSIQIIYYVFEHLFQTSKCTSIEKISAEAAAIKTINESIAQPF